MERHTGKRATIPITVRQLEALVRLSESLAKMRMMPFATEGELNTGYSLRASAATLLARSTALSSTPGLRILTPIPITSLSPL
jgi:DNA replication licensing factor MCM5